MLAASIDPGESLERRQMPDPLAVSKSSPGKIDALSYACGEDATTRSDSDPSMRRLLPGFLDCRGVTMDRRHTAALETR